MDFLLRYSIGARLMFLLVLSMLSVGILMSTSLYNLNRSLLADRELKTRHLVEVAHGILAAYQNKVAQGTLDEAQAKAQAIALLRSLRYEDKEYFWINDMQPRMVMHPFKPELEGKDLSDTADPNGNKLFLAFVAKVKSSQAGFVRYHWPKPGHDEPVAKLSYVKGFQPWGWVVGSGIYIDDVETAFWQEAKWNAGVAVVILLVLGGAMSYIGRSIVRPLETLGSLMQTMQESRDLTARANIKGRDEASWIAYSFNNMVDSFREIVREISSHAAQVAGTAKGLTLAASAVSESSVQQTASATSSASAVEQLSSSVASVADQATAVLSYSNESLQRAQHGNESLAELTAIISETGTSVHAITGAIASFLENTHRISRLTQQVRDIAEQTNLLALNAAIEAARAGEQGRGFAVVADEVRKLAEKSASAAREIDTVTSSVEQHSFSVQAAVDKGTASLQASESFLSSLAEVLLASTQAVAKTEAGVNGITDSVHQQYQATEHISRSVDQVAAMAEKNHDAVEQVFTATRELEQLSATLLGCVERFHV